jgi:hypothetical protein
MRPASHTLDAYFYLILPCFCSALALLLLCLCSASALPLLALYDLLALPALPALSCFACNVLPVLHCLLSSSGAYFQVKQLWDRITAYELCMREVFVYVE